MMYLCKYVMLMLNSPPPPCPLSLGAGAAVAQHSVFQAQRGQGREEARGAQEVPEEDNIMVDLPVDQAREQTHPQTQTHMHTFPCFALFCTATSIVMLSLLL